MVNKKIVATFHSEKSFQLSKFRGIFSHLNINVEQEVLKMREEWKNIYYPLSNDS